MEIKSLERSVWTEGMNMKRNTKIKKIITGFLLYLLLIAFAVPLCACSSKNDEEEYEEEESRDKKKKKKDSDEEDKDKPDETLTEKLQSMMPGPENADEAYAEFGKTLTLIAGKSFDYSTSGVEGEYGYDYETDTKDVPMGCLGYMLADFDGDGGVPGLADSSELINFTRQLLARRYSEQDIQKIWGGNFMRVMAIAQDKKQ